MAYCLDVFIEEMGWLVDVEAVVESVGEVGFAGMYF
jgi:hypothetical protein